MSAETEAQARERREDQVWRKAIPGPHKEGAIACMEAEAQRYAPLVEAARGLPFDAPVCETLDGATRCFYCRAFAGGERVYHSAQCPWPKFRQALADLGPKDIMSDETSI